MFLFGKRKKNQKEDKQEAIEDQQAAISESETSSDSNEEVALVNPALIQELAGEPVKEIDTQVTETEIAEPKQEQAPENDKPEEIKEDLNTAIDNLLVDPITPHDVTLDKKVSEVAQQDSQQKKAEQEQASPVQASEKIEQEQVVDEASTEIEEKEQASLEDADTSKETADASETDTTPENAFIVEAGQETEQAAPAKKGLFSRLRQGLSKTGSALTEGMGVLVLGHKKVDDDLLEDLETRLLMADVGIEATQEIMDDLTNRVSRKQLSDVDSLMKALEEKMSGMLEPAAKPLTINADQKPTVILMVGINGAGKTTTIGKLAKKYQAAGKSVMLAAGDTFRAAAVEQLQTWGERNKVPVVAQKTGSDTASVIYDAVQSAQARNIDILLADTAGRLHTQDNLMDELKKVKRVIQKLDETAPHEIMLIVDASIGQNALVQAREFNQALGVTGITITKLDGTAKGGILFAIAQQLDVAIRYVGVGEGIDDLQVFDAQKFAQALLATDNTE